MALQTSGAISLNDIHVEAGGTTGTQASLNDADIRGLISKSDGAQMSFNEWYGASSGPTTLYSADMHTGSQTYRGCLASAVPGASWTGQTYNYGATLSDDTFDPIASQNIASTSTQSTPGIIRDLMTLGNLNQTYLRVWAVTAPSDSGWTSIRCQGTGSDTHDKTLQRTNGNAFYNSSSGYRQYRWGTSSNPEALIPAYDTNYTITVT